MNKSIKRLGLCLLSAGFIFQAASASASAQEGHTHYKNDDNKILTVAHRGASGYAPEHTIPSYRLGDKMKGDYIEIDLQMTKDGNLVAMHDETVDRTTNGNGLVKDLTLNEIKQLDAGSWFNKQYPQYARPEYAGLKVPTLEEIFKTFGTDKHYYIETKSPEVYPGMEEKLLTTLKEYKLIDSKNRSKHVIVQSFSKDSLLKVHSMNPTIPLVQLLWYDVPGVITDAELQDIKKYAIGVGPNFDKINEEFVKKARSYNLLVHPYTINEKSDMKRALDWGVTGVFTNFPDRFQQVLKDYNKENRHSH